MGAGGGDSLWGAPRKVTSGSKGLKKVCFRWIAWVMIFAPTGNFLFSSKFSIISPSKKIQYFSYQIMGGKEIFFFVNGGPGGHDFGHPLDRKQFFRCGLRRGSQGLCGGWKIVG